MALIPMNAAGLMESPLADGETVGDSVVEREGVVALVAVATIHDQLPVILTEHAEQRWLDPDVPSEEATSVLAAYDAAS